MINKIRLLYSYKNIFFSTKITYWWKYYQHTYAKKKKCLDSYMIIPNNLQISFLPVKIDVLKRYLNNHEGIRDKILSSADDILNEKFTLFNIQTKKILGEWHKDPVTGYEFPKVYYKDVRKVCPQGALIENNDIKYPWELSCSHFLITLAEAYLLTEQVKYEEMFFRYLEDWHKNNPLGIGVTWSCTLDVAMRTVNFIVAASLFDKIDVNFKNRFQKYVGSIYSHLLFINDNLEYGFVRENHYLSDIVGLKMAAQCFPNDKKAQKCYKLAANSIKEEIVYQICKDGVDHEASSCYHGFCLELFLVALSTDQKLRSSLSNKEYLRLRNMVRFTEELCKFAQYPVIGDNDGERVMDLNGTGTFRKEVVQFGKQILGLSTEDNEYSFLIDGHIKMHNDSYKKTQILKYTQGGYAIVDNGRMRLLLHAGCIGRKGRGGHGHNDQTSFSLDIYGNSFIIDPGSMVYERNLQLRHEYRSTGIHNCVSIDGKEQNNIRISRPFMMSNDTKALYAIDDMEDYVLVKTTHKGYRKKCNCFVERNIYIRNNMVKVVDTINGSLSNDLSLLLTFAEGIYLEKNGYTITAYLEGRHIANLSFIKWNVDIVEGRFSPTYAVEKKVEALSLNAKKNDMMTELTFTIEIIQ